MRLYLQLRIAHHDLFPHTINVLLLARVILRDAQSAVFPSIIPSLTVSFLRTVWLLARLMPEPGARHGTSATAPACTTLRFNGLLVAESDGIPRICSWMDGRWVSGACPWMYVQLSIIRLTAPYLITRLTPKVDNLAGADAVKSQNLTGSEEAKGKTRRSRPCRRQL